jgi:hypothetical protein
MRTIRPNRLSMDRATPLRCKPEWLETAGTMLRNKETEAARWVSREKLADGAVLPPPRSRLPPRSSRICSIAAGRSRFEKSGATSCGSRGSQERMRSQMLKPPAGFSVIMDPQIQESTHANQRLCSRLREGTHRTLFV